MPIVEAFRSDGWNFFYDEETPGGSNWEDHIHEELEMAVCMILVLGKELQSSFWMREEIQIFRNLEEQKGRKLHPRILPLEINDYERRLGYATHRCIDFKQWDGNLFAKPWQELTKALSRWDIHPQLRLPYHPRDNQKPVNEVPFISPPVNIPKKQPPTADKEPETQKNPPVKPVNPNNIDPTTVPVTVWVSIPAGVCISKGGEKHHLDAFEMSCFPITQRQFQLFINDRGYEDLRWWVDSPLWVRDAVPMREFEADVPISLVSWYEARAFCRWLSDKTGRSIRLPTQLEWIRAARGEKEWAYPWEGSYRLGSSNINEKVGFAAGSHLGKITTVGAYPHDRSVFGLWDMVGNVHEWCEAPNSKLAQPYCGGAYISSPRRARIFEANTANPSLRIPTIGFRVVAPL